jgi:hypothetical protein
LGAARHAEHVGDLRGHTGGQQARRLIKMKEDEMPIEHNSQLGTIEGHVIDVGHSPTRRRRQARNAQDGLPVVNAVIKVSRTKPADSSYTIQTNAYGYYRIDVPIDVPAGTTYDVECDAFWSSKPKQHQVTVKQGKNPYCNFDIEVGLRLTCQVASTADQTRVAVNEVTAGTPVILCAEHTPPQGQKQVTTTWNSEPDTTLTAIPQGDPNHQEMLVRTDGLSGPVKFNVTLIEGLHSPQITATANINFLPRAAQPVSGQVGVMLQRAAVPPTPDVPLWAAIRTHAKAMSFGGVGRNGEWGSGYQGFIDSILCRGRDISGNQLPDACPKPDLQRLVDASKNYPLYGMTAYDLLKTATEVFLLLNCGVVVRRKDALNTTIDSDNEELARSGLDVKALSEGLATYLGQNRLPYIQRIVQTAFPGDTLTNNSVFCTGVLQSRVFCPCLIELIWSYWHEEGMLVQTLNAISRRFQNVRGPGDRDPLAHLEIDPLRPLNSLLWGYIQDERNRLTVMRRACEYTHEYGTPLQGKAVGKLRSADSRSKFLEGFHNLLHRCSIFYKEDNDTTVIADGFPLLNALKEVHLLLAQGAHNQFGDLPWTARVEMMTQQWLLARPEMRDFLQSRPMVPYTEAWMPQVDTMKTLQGWSDVTVTHFRDLAVFGEQIVLTVRYGDWIDVNDENSAKNWARYWRPEIQAYIHAYRAATGVDLTSREAVDYTPPAVHLQKRLAMQRVR